MSNEREPSRFRPSAREISGRQLSLLRIIPVLLLLALTTASVVTTDLPSDRTNIVTIDESTSSAGGPDTMYYVGLPVAANVYGAETLGARGYAYTHVQGTLGSQNATLYFVEFPGGTTHSQNLGFGHAILSAFLVADVDHDGHDEFVVNKRPAPTVGAVCVVDFNDDSYVEYTYSGVSAVFLGTGDFNGDSHEDLAMLVDGADYLQIMDLSDGTILSTFDPGTDILRSAHAIGHFSDSTLSQIAVTNYTHVWIINGDGSVEAEDTHPTIRDMTTFQMGTGYDELAIIDFVGTLHVRTGDLTLAYSATVATGSSQMFIWTGNVTGDSQQDLIITSRTPQAAYFIDGSDGAVERQANGINPTGSMVDVGIIDSDILTDLVTVTPDGYPCFVHGSNGDIAYVETLIETVSRIDTYDINSDSQTDMFIQSGSDLYIFLSEGVSPVIVPSPLEPAHPTVIDDFITVEVQVEEGTAVESADLYIRRTGDTDWIQPHDEMFTPDEGGTYFAFLVGFRAGTYEYFIEVRDVFLNTGSLGSQSAPLTLDIVGHLAWEQETPTMGTRWTYHQIFARGNESDGRTVLYMLETAESGKTIYLNKYETDGTLADTQSIDFTGGFDYWLVSGNMDGDNIVDPVVLVSLGTSTSAHVFDGSSFTLDYVKDSTIMEKTLRFVEAIDTNGDAITDIVFLRHSDDYAIARLNGATQTWTQQLMPSPSDSSLAPKLLDIAESGSGKGNNITVARGSGLIHFFDGADISSYVTVAIPKAGYTDVDLRSLVSYRTAGSPGNSYALGCTFWSGTTPETKVFVFDGSAGDLTDLTEYSLMGEDLSFMYAWNTDADDADELFLHTNAGDLLLVSLDGGVTVHWSTPVSDSTPLSATVVDFDGDSEDEFVLFTKEDELLTAVGFTGEIDRVAKTGEVYYPIPVGNVDPGLGEDIAAYPIYRGTQTVLLGAIRDLDWFYRMAVSVEFGPADVIQGAAFASNVTVRNIYDELVEDATIYMSASFNTPEGVALNTFGFYYDEGASAYRAVTDATWPLGLANLSIRVSHDFYHPWNQDYPDSVTVRSMLSIEVSAKEFLPQGDDQTVIVLVTDNLGGTVDGATVSVTIDGIGYPTVFEGRQYMLDYPEVDLPVGQHNIEATAVHPYSTEEASAVKVFTVQLLTTDLLVFNDFPAVVGQDSVVNSLFVIEDAYGNPVLGAEVYLKSGPRSFPLVEVPAIPGTYNFSHIMDLGVGQHTYELMVERLNVIGPAAMELTFEVYGTLVPNVFYEQRVAGGSYFTVDVFVKDKYGPVFGNVNVSIDINGTLYWATNIDGGPEFQVTVYADFRVGSNNFTVYVDAEYAQPWERDLSIRAYTDASSAATPHSSEGWSIVQGITTQFSIDLVDWLDRPVSGGTVTMSVRGTSFNLIEVSPGVYSVAVSTAGWSPGEYNWTAQVSHDDIETGDPIRGSITIVGELSLEVDYLPQEPVQGQPLEVIVRVYDKYGNPVPRVELLLSLRDLPQATATPTDVVGEYSAYFPVLPQQGYGDYTLAIEVSGEFVLSEAFESPITIKPAVPNMQLSTPALTMGAGVSLLLSLIGMFVYFRLASSMNIRDQTLTGKQRTVRRLDRLYLLIVASSGVGVIGSAFLYNLGDYASALIITIVLLGASVLLYGLWLYRDAVSSVMIKEAVSKKRIVAGLWHLVFVPGVIVMIMIYGAGIDWFRAYVIDQSITFGDIVIPTIMTTIFTAYLSSILVVVVNIYREIRNGLKRISRMEEAGTPTEVVEEERVLMIGKLSSSIRVKFLMFLVVVGAATVMSMDWLRNYNLGIIVLMPVVFLVVIPFIASRVIKFFGKTAEIARGGGKGGGAVETPAATEIP